VIEEVRVRRSCSPIQLISRNRCLELGFAWSLAGGCQGVRVAGFPAACRGGSRSARSTRSRSRPTDRFIATSRQESKSELLRRQRDESRARQQIENGVPAQPPREGRARRPGWPRGSFDLGRPVLGDRRPSAGWRPMFLSGSDPLDVTGLGSNTASMSASLARLRGESARFLRSAHSGLPRVEVVEDFGRSRSTSGREVSGLEAQRDSLRK